jgi:adenosylcobinamide kinase / adenosylcobinamide-phosphate guanylyltransferase
VSGRLVLITGGARSGKSRFARERAAAGGSPVLFVATGLATDPEMAARIARHRTERPAEWTTLEARYDLASALRGRLSGERCVLLDDLAAVVSNLLVERSADEREILAEVEELLGLARKCSLELIVVSQEVGLGLVPSTALGRQFRDLVGFANQAMAAAADEVLLLVAGLPLRLKG